MLQQLPLAAIAAGPEADTGAAFYSFVFENDAFVGEDAGYTAGLFYQWGRGDVTDRQALELWDWINDLDFLLVGVDREGRRHGVTYTVSSQINTPDDIRFPGPIPGDQPYAGLLLWDVRQSAWDSEVADHFDLTLGIVGPLSGAEQIQKLGHKITGSNEPEGWDNQLDNEPVFRAEWQRNYRLLERPAGEGREFDVVATGIGGFGNLRSDAGASLTIRWGKHLARSFATVDPLQARSPELTPMAPEFSWRVFATLYGSYVLNDIRLDGNTFSNSLSVPLKHWQALGEIGASATWRNWEFMFTLQHGSDTFEGQVVDTGYGALRAAYRWR